MSELYEMISEGSQNVVRAEELTIEYSKMTKFIGNSFSLFRGPPVTTIEVIEMLKVSK